MPSLNRSWTKRVAHHARFSVIVRIALLSVLGSVGTTALSHAEVPLCERLKDSGFKIAYECYVHDNWELFVMNADGSEPKNLTNTPKEHEHYPQVSPDGGRICYSVDAGEGREAIRSLWIMDSNGKNRRKLADYAREPFWAPDNKRVGYLPQEFPKFNVIDYYTRGLTLVDIQSAEIQPHPNSTNLHHLYNPCFAANGRWIVSTVHAGMGFEHAIVAIEAQGDRVVNLKIPGCRPCLSPDGRQLAWGPGDHEIAVAPIDLESDLPKVGAPRLRIQDKTNETYHVDWSPDGRFLSLSRGPATRGDPTKTGTFQAACEIVGVYAPGWNLCVVPAEADGIIDLNNADDTKMLMLTSDGLSNKESAWFRAKRSGH